MRILKVCGALIRSALRLGSHTPDWSWPPTFGCGELLRWSRSRFRTGAEKTGTDVAVGQGSSLELLGFIVAQVTRRSVGHILTIDVPSANRRFGVGSKLLATAEQRLRASACHSVELETAVDNAGALAFYKRHGYSVVKTIPRYYTNGVDAFVLEKEL